MRTTIVQSGILMVVLLLLGGAGCKSSRSTARPGDPDGASGSGTGADGASRDPTRSEPLADEPVLPGRVHQVRPGETLYSIARQYYGEDRQYKKIWAANRNRVKDPNKIRIGMKLIIP
jgi:nucleoid-associated protein YgaU